MCLTQGALAKKLGYTAGSHVSAIEKNKALPSIEVLEKLSELNKSIDLHWLVTGQESPSVNTYKDKLVEVTNRIAPYLGYEVQYTIEQKTKLLKKKDDLLRELDEGRLVFKEIAEIESEIGQAKEALEKITKDLLYIQNPFKNS